MKTEIENISSVSTLIIKVIFLSITLLCILLLIYNIFIILQDIESKKYYLLFLPITLLIIFKFTQYFFLLQYIYLNNKRLFCSSVFLKREFEIKKGMIKKIKELSVIHGLNMIKIRFIKNTLLGKNIVIIPRFGLEALYNDFYIKKRLEEYLEDAESENIN